MKGFSKRHSGLWAVAVLTVLVATAALAAAGANARETGGAPPGPPPGPPPPGQKIGPKLRPVVTGRVRDPWRGPALPPAPARSAPAPLRTEPDEYAREKSAANAAAAPRPARVGELAAPTERGVNREGANKRSSGGGASAPDTHGASGTQYYAEVTNSAIDIYYKTDGSPVPNGHRLLQDFFSYNNTIIFDPRILKDPWTGRWIVIAIGENEDYSFNSNFAQRLFIGISKGVDVTAQPDDDPLKSEWCFYTPNVNYSGNEFFDYPQLGIDQNSIIITGDVAERGGDAAKYGQILTFPKQAMYDCASPVTYLVFSGFPTHLAPPIVHDSNPRSFLVRAPRQGSALELYAGENLGDYTRGSMTFQGYVPVPSYTVPAGAAQCGRDLHPLDTGDSRFVNASTQWGRSLWNVHTTSYSSSSTLATPRYYEIDTTTNSVIKTGQFWTYRNASDFNASIAANEHGEAVVTWTATSPKNPCLYPQVRYTGYQPGDYAADLGAGAVASSSDRPYNPPLNPYPYIGCGAGQLCIRWGDYSAVSLDPSPYGTCLARRRAWIVNEKMLADPDPSNLRVWSSRFARVGFC